MRGHTQVKNKLIHKDSIPEPCPDLSAGIRADYNEALGISNISPRAAAALLRLATRKLCTELGQGLNGEVEELDVSGLPPKVQEALIELRIVGRDAVQPGGIDLRDDAATVDSLFELLNYIAVNMIAIHEKSTPSTPGCP